MEELNKKRIIISGATACGKSSFALNLASALNSDIINIDSVQIYKDYNIGSAKPDATALSVVNHHLIDFVSPADDFNVFAYQALLKDKLKELDNLEKASLIVGGSTLYIKTFIEGIANLESKEEVQVLREKLEKKDKDLLYKELLELDKVAASKINKNDKFRIVRALELIKTYNLPLSQVIKNNMCDSNKNNALIFVLCREREELHHRINKRTENMLKDGLIEEAKSLVSNYGSNAKIFKTLGLREALMVINEELEADKLLEELSKNTRRYAKRQMTFWRNEPQKNGWEILSSSLYDTVNLENILVNKLKYNQVTDLIDDYMENKDLETKVVYLDASYLN